MLADRYFYPLALIVIGAIIATALSLGSKAELNEADIRARGWSISGLALQDLSVSTGSELEFVNREGGYVTLSQFRSFDMEPPSIGVFATVGPAYEAAFAGESLTITLRARASGDRPLKRMHSAYYPLEANPSPWQEFELTDQWADYSYSFTPPQTATDPHVDLMAVFPGWAGEMETMDLASIRIMIDPDPT